MKTIIAKKRGRPVGSKNKTTSKKTKKVTKSKVVKASKVKTPKTKEKIVTTITSEVKKKRGRPVGWRKNKEVVAEVKVVKEKKPSGKKVKEVVKPIEQVVVKKPEILLNSQNIKVGQLVVVKRGIYKKYKMMGKVMAIHPKGIEYYCDGFYMAEWHDIIKVIEPKNSVHAHDLTLAMKELAKTDKDVKQAKESLNHSQSNDNE